MNLGDLNLDDLANYDTGLADSLQDLDTLSNDDLGEDPIA